MKGKYRDPISLSIAYLRRQWVRRGLKNLVQWQPIDQPKKGYTAIIGVKHELAEILKATLRCLANQNLANLHETILVFDTTRSNHLESLAKSLREQHPTLRIRHVFYSTIQHATALRLRTPWVYAWLSWSIAIAQSSTRHILIQDLDAMLIDPGIIETRYQRLLELNTRFFGDSSYSYNGLQPADNLASTWELLFDAAFIRQHYRPVDLTNRVGRCGDRYVDYDILLAVQNQIESTAVEQIDRETFVHPAQVAHQFTEMQRASHYVSPKIANLFFVPYFVSISGNASPLDTLIGTLEDTQIPTSRFPFFDHTVDFTALTPQYADWIATQVRRTEAGIFGSTRPEADRFLQALKQRFM